MDYLDFMNTSTEKKKTIDLFGKVQGLLEDSPKPNNLLPANPPVVPAQNTNDAQIVPANNISANSSNDLFSSAGNIAGTLLGGPIGGAIGGTIGGLAGNALGGLFTNDDAIKEQQLQQQAQSQANLEQEKYDKMKKNLPQPQFLQGV